MITEASTIGLKPGNWPKEIILDGIKAKRRATEWKHGELLSVDYETEQGILITVLND